MKRTDDIEKVYFQMGEVENLLGVEASAIRYWLDYFKMDTDHRGPNNYRLLTHGDVEILIKIKELSDTKEYTLVGIGKRIERLLHNRNISIGSRTNKTPAPAPESPRQ
jgi:DNA-binding transcriptional MerR regulator